MKLFPEYWYKNPLIAATVALLDLISWPIGAFLDRCSVGPVKNILIVNLGGIGDIILIEPLLRALRKDYPTARIDCLASSKGSEAAELIGFDKTLVFEESKGRLAAWAKNFFKLKKELQNSYSLAFDVKGDLFVSVLLAASSVPYRIGFTNGGLGTLFHRRRNGFRKEPRARTILSLWREEGKAEPLLALPKRTIGPEILVHLGAGEASKLWPIKEWSVLIELLAKDFPLRLIGSEHDRMIYERLGAPAREALAVSLGISLKETAGLLARARLFIGHDSGPVHLASALRIKTLCLFSLAHDPRVWAPAEAVILTFEPGDQSRLHGETVYRRAKEMIS